MNTNHITKGQKIAFVDRWGETRHIHKAQNGALAVEREGQTVALHLNQIVARLIGARIKTKRLAKGMSLEALCVRAGLRSSTPKSRMWEIENALRKEGLRLGTIYALAIGLECEVGDLLPSVEEVRTLSSIEPTTTTEYKMKMGAL